MDGRGEATAAGEAAAGPQRHPRALETPTLVVSALLSGLGAVIGLVLITSLGVACNTAVIGALLAMLLGRLPIAALSGMRSRHRQNLVQSAVSGATFAAANSLIVPVSVPFLLGRADLVWPVLGGAVIGLAVDSWVLYRTFDSRLLPASGAWPPGIAAAETIEAGDRGGRKARLLAIGAATGVAGSVCGLPMSAAGVAFLGNMWALGMFGTGLLAAQYAPGLLRIDLAALYIPHGLMIGAGAVALIQALLLLRARRGDHDPAGPARDSRYGKVFAAEVRTVDDRHLRRGLRQGLVLFTAGAALVALAGGLAADMSGLALAGWVLFAGTGALVHQLIVGLAAMHSGWFPAFAVTLIFLILGLLLHLPPTALALLVGYVAATGPAFADMGYDLKAGWLLRAEAVPWLPFEHDGRRQQYLAQLIGFTVALTAVALLWHPLFSQGRIPPLSKVYTTTIETGLEDSGTLVRLGAWGLCGAVVQWLGGSQRQLGVLLATGLLVAAPQAGWLVLGALAVRAVHRARIRRGDHLAATHPDDTLVLLGAGLIAGSSLYDVTRLRETL
ncbi:OPT/YSL family transporter [Streptomyces sp. NPDC126503]|uniref:OPT/YSL family transporter n=1 Tax=Streptomyces sp. NPDC126503 TaxID=3155315 RepID=UPI003328E38E